MDQRRLEASTIVDFYASTAAMYLERAEELATDYPAEAELCCVRGLEAENLAGRLMETWELGHSEIAATKRHLLTLLARLTGDGAAGADGPGGEGG